MQFVMKQQGLSRDGVREPSDARGQLFLYQGTPESPKITFVASFIWTTPNKKRTALSER